MQNPVVQISNDLALEMQLKPPSMVQDELEEGVLQSAICYRTLLNTLKKQRRIENDAIARNKLLISQNIELVRLFNEAQNMKVPQSSLQKSVHGISNSSSPVFKESQNYNEFSSFSRGVKPCASEMKCLPILEHPFSLREIWECLNGINNEIRTLNSTQRDTLSIRDELSRIRNSNVILASTVSRLRKNEACVSKEENMMVCYSDHIMKPSVGEPRMNLNQKELHSNRSLEISKIHDRISNLKFAILQKTNAIDVKSNEIAFKRQKIEDMVRISTKLAEQNRQLNTFLNRESETVSDYEALVKTTENKIYQLQEKLNYITGSCSNLQNERDQLQMRIKSFRKQQNQFLKHKLETVDMWIQQKREKLTSDFHTAIENFFRFRKITTMQSDHGKTKTSSYGSLGCERSLQNDHSDFAAVSDSNLGLEDLFFDRKPLRSGIQEKDAVTNIANPFYEKSSSKNLKSSLDRSSSKMHPYFNHELEFSSSSGQNSSSDIQSSRNHQAAKGYGTTASKTETEKVDLLAKPLENETPGFPISKSYAFGYTNGLENNTSLKLPVGVSHSNLDEKHFFSALSPVTPGGITKSQEVLGENAEAKIQVSGLSNSTMIHFSNVLPVKPESPILSKDPLPACFDAIELKKPSVSLANESQIEATSGCEKTVTTNQSPSTEEPKNIVSHHMEPRWDNINSEMENPTGEAPLKNVERWKDRIRGRAESAASLERYDTSLLPKPYDPSRNIGNDTRAESNESIQEDSECCADLEPAELLSSDLEGDCNRSSVDLVSEDDFCEFTQVSDSVKSSEHLSIEEGSGQRKVKNDSGSPSDQYPNLPKSQKPALGQAVCCSSPTLSNLCNNISCSAYSPETLEKPDPCKRLSGNQGVLPVSKFTSEKHDSTLEQRNNVEANMHSTERDLGSVQNATSRQETFPSSSTQEIGTGLGPKLTGHLSQPYDVLLFRNPSCVESNEKYGQFKIPLAQRGDTNQVCSMEKSTFLEKKENGSLNKCVNMNVNSNELIPQGVKTNYPGDDESRSLLCNYPKTNKLTDLVGCVVEGNCTKLTEEFISKSGVGTKDFTFERITNPVEKLPTVRGREAVNGIRSEIITQGLDYSRFEVEEYDCVAHNSQNKTQISPLTSCKQKGTLPADTFTETVEREMPEARVQPKDFFGGETSTGNEIKRCPITGFDEQPSPSQQFEPTEEVTSSREDSMNPRAETNIASNSNNLEQHRGMSLSKFVLGKHWWAGFFRWS